MRNDFAVLLGRAYHFAAVQHLNQRRKGELAEPYMNHLTEVADLVATATNGTDLELIIAAVLHDTVEDTTALPADIERLFGRRVAGIVAEVTDDKSIPKAERKRLQIEHAAHASDEARIVKMADKISNLRSLANSPPVDWDCTRRRQYVEWATQVVEHCKPANEILYAEFHMTAPKVLQQIS
jgi:(p)ppGpp synthase/HD superfamily hydrolase